MISIITLLPTGGHTSGYTKVTREGQYYRISATTPNISFAINPATGRSGEQEYHARAKRDFEAMLEKLKPLIERNVATLRSELDLEGPRLLPFDSTAPQTWDHQLSERPGPGPSRIELLIDSPPGSVELLFATAPSKDRLNAIRRRVKDLFSLMTMAPGLSGERYRVTLGARADFSLDPATQEAVTPELVRMKPVIEKSVAALVAEMGEALSLSPFRDTDPFVWDNELGAEARDGRCRMAIQARRGTANDDLTLYLSFGKIPTKAQFASLEARASQLLSAEEVVDDSHWSVHRPVFWIFHSSSERWIFHFGGAVEAVGVWKGSWKKEGDHFSVYLDGAGEPDANNSFVVEFAADGRAFTAFKGGVELKGSREK